MMWQAQFAEMARLLMQGKWSAVNAASRIEHPMGIGKSRDDISGYTMLFRFYVA